MNFFLNWILPTISLILTIGVVFFQWDFPFKYWVLILLMVAILILVGKDGLLKLLKNKGYKVEQLR